MIRDLIDLIKIFTNNDLHSLIYTMLLAIASIAVLKSDIFFKVISYKKFKLQYYDDLSTTISFCLNKHNNDSVKNIKAYKLKTKYSNINIPKLIIENQLLKIFDFSELKTILICRFIKRNDSYWEFNIKLYKLLMWWAFVVFYFFIMIYEIYKIYNSLIHELYYSDIDHYRAIFSLVLTVFMETVAIYFAGLLSIKIVSIPFNSIFIYKKVKSAKHQYLLKNKHYYMGEEDRIELCKYF